MEICISESVGSRIYGNFKICEDSYYADLVELPSIGPECLIFKKIENEILWDILYSRRDIPYSKNALLDCIIEFIEENYVN